jgi:hypothetical protein
MSRINRRVADMPFFEHGSPGWIARLAARFRPRSPEQPATLAP